MSARRR